jgi:hypothetical protein
MAFLTCSLVANARIILAMSRENPLHLYASFCWLTRDWEVWRASPSKERSFCCCFLPASLAKSSNKRTILEGLQPRSPAGELASSITHNALVKSNDGFYNDDALLGHPGRALHIVHNSEWRYCLLSNKTFSYFSWLDTPPLPLCAVRSVHTIGREHSSFKEMHTTRLCSHYAATLSDRRPWTYAAFSLQPTIAEGRASCEEVNAGVAKLLLGYLIVTPSSCCLDSTKSSNVRRATTTAALYLACCCHPQRVHLNWNSLVLQTRLQPVQRTPA